MSTTDLSGTTAVVTGASRGFGRATAISLSDAGAHVIGVARGEAQLAELQQQLGDLFTPMVADVRDADLATRLITEYRPRTLVLDAGATPPAAPLQEQTWESFSQNWEVDVQHVFRFLHRSLLAPLDPGAVVVSFSSGAAMRGSPLSGGYAGSKAMIRFLSAYAAAEARRKELSIRFVSVLPQITPVTQLGAPFVEAYAKYADLSIESYLSQFGDMLTAEQVAKSVVDLVTDDEYGAEAYLLTAGAISPLG